jgi:hypothetical protein
LLDTTIESQHAEITQLFFGQTLRELEVAERVLTRFGGATTKDQTIAKGVRAVSMERGEQGVASLSLRSCYQLFEVDRLMREARRSPVDADRLATAIDSMAVVLQTPFFSSDKVDDLADTPAVLPDKPTGRGRRRPRAKPRQYQIDFGTVSAFIDLMSDVVTDGSFRSFVVAVARDGVNHLFNNFVRWTPIVRQPEPSFKV